jgi:hypothetical protein
MRSNEELRSGRSGAGVSSGTAQAVLGSEVDGIAVGSLFAFAGPYAGHKNRVNFVLDPATGAQRRLAHLPSGTTLYTGTPHTLLGTYSYRHNGRVRAFPWAVLDATGKIRGTVCTRYSVIAQVDDKHLIAIVEHASQAHETTKLVELSPRR